MSSGNPLATRSGTDLPAAAAAAAASADEVAEEQAESVFPLRRSGQPRAKRFRHTAAQLFCRIDVCWTFFYFLFLCCIGVATVSITQVKIVSSLVMSLRDVHNIHINTIYKKIDLGTARVFNMAAGYLALQTEEENNRPKEVKLSTLCTVLAAYDTSLDLRSLAMTSLFKKEAMSCMHGDPAMSSPAQQFGWITNGSVIPGVYLINSSTQMFNQPLEAVYGGWPESEYNLSATFDDVRAQNPIFADAVAFYNGELDRLDYTRFWRSFPELPHIIYCFIPVGALFRGLPLPAGMHLTDYVDVRVDGAGILTSRTPHSLLTSITAAAFVNVTLGDADPSVMTNNWGQVSVNDTEILTSSQLHPVKYLKASEISNPLMRAALKRINVSTLRQEGCNYTVLFHYRGAPALASVVRVTTVQGLMLPMVFVTSHRDIAMAYTLAQNLSNGATAVVIVIMTAVFWLFIHRHLHNPLHRIANLLLASVKRGSRVLFRSSKHDRIALTEVQQLGAAHNAAMRQLREIDTFIPEAVRKMFRAEGSRSTRSVSLSRSHIPVEGNESSPSPPRSERLITHLSTVVYIAIRPDHSATAAKAAPTLRDVADDLPQRNRLAAFAATAARSVPLVNSGPFQSPDDVEAFAEKLHSFSAAHNGMVLRFTPDTCILHFCYRVRRQLTRRSSVALSNSGAADEEGEEMQARDTHATVSNAKLEALAMQDASDALAFAIDLQTWVEAHDGGTYPDVRMLVDTSMFTCGHYRPRRSEQMLPIAIGRDVQREVGHVPALIGVHIAMTEETASCVRAAGSRSVRHIPVEALCIGRITLDADVVVLYEALPGPAEDDEAWRLYSGLCTDGFNFMMHGRYADALTSFKDIAGISDLEPGLMPKSLRREAASSSATGGAVSTQVERLMKECERRLRTWCSDGFYRLRHCPLGIDAVLQHVPVVFHETVQRAPAASQHCSSPSHPSTPHRVEGLSERLAAMSGGGGCCGGGGDRVCFPVSAERSVMELKSGQEVVRAVIPSPPQCILDNAGLCWSLSTRSYALSPQATCEARFPALGPAGALATVTYRIFYEVHSAVRNAIRDAPLGPLSDALRSAVPVVGATPEQAATAETLFVRQQELRHPNLLIPMGYSLSVEGGVALLWEYFACGTLRQVSARYARLKPITVTRFMRGVLSGLLFLHRRGQAHGALSIDKVMLDATGVCKLRGHCAIPTVIRKLFVEVKNRYISPAMAAGAPPTPSCDMFCYGLLCIATLTNDKVWTWAPAAEGQPRRSEAELSAMLDEAGTPFREAVANGLIIADTSIFDTLALEDEYMAQGRTMLLRCVSRNPSERPSALEMLKLIDSQVAQEASRRSRK